MKTYIIDRLDEDFAVCEDEAKEQLLISTEQLPENAKEGDVLQEEDGYFSVNQEETEARRARMRRKLMDLFE